MRLVDIDELAKHEHWKNVVRQLSCAPIVDAVPVVRCKNCVHYVLTGRPPFMYYVCKRIGAIRSVDKDDFCKYGERREQ